MEELLKKLVDAIHGPTELTNPKPQRLDDDSEPFMLVPDGFSLESLQQFASTPLRVKTHPTVRTPDQFIAYVNRYKNPSSIIFVTPDLDGIGSKALATAIIDYHRHSEGGDGENDPRWGEHRVSLLASTSPEYQLLSSIDGKLMPQEEFALHVKNLARFATSIPPAELLEVVRTLTLTSSGSFASLSDDISGSVNLKYQLEVNANAGSTQERKLTVPADVVFELPILLGGSVFGVRAELLYRVPQQAGGKVSMGFRLPDRKFLELEILSKVARDCEAATELLTVTGTAETRV